MSSDRKQQITSIFHSAIEREGTERRAFLDGACASDEELRREVESLIRSHENAGSLMNAPAYERDAALLDELNQRSFIGRTLGHYRIVRRLGGGGMGEVFLAEDTQLGRRVAVKILPHRLTSDSSLVARFRQEARAASALNHQNIVTIHEVGESDGTHFIATEYVDGVTLRERMSRTPLTVGEALDIAAQIAAALSKAHSAGVVHRDIKPENVMVDEEGHAKVLDFGIAKLVEPSRDSATEAPTALKVETSPGAVMGTAHYMSPEQTRALRDVDARTDVWSVGVVLYEMLAGRLPFEGATPSDVMSAILNKEPPPLARFNREVSETLELVVEKALEKKRDERYQTAKDLLSDLRRVRQRFDSATTTQTDDQSDASAAETRATSLLDHGAPGTGGARPGETVPVHTTSSAEYIVTEIKRHKRGIVIALVALVVVGAGVAFALYKYAGRQKPAAPPIFQNFTVSRITTSGQAQDASISPDGKYIVYLEMTDDGSRGLYVKQTATGNVIPIVPPTKGNVLRDTSFSPDGNFVYYRFYDRINPFALYQVSSVGGTSRKVIDRCNSAAAVSPDGLKIAFVRSGPKSGLVVANVDGTGERVLASLAENEWFNGTGPTWSPDGKKMAITAGANVDGVDHMKLLGIDAKSGAIRELSPKRWVEAGRVVWMPDGAALALMATERTDEVGSQVWRVAYPSGEASRITNDVQARDDSSLGVTADGRTLVTVTQQILSRIETVPEGGDVSRLTRLTSAAANGEGYEGFDLAPDGRVVFSSYEGGQFDLWVMNPDGGGRQRLTSDTHVEDDPTVSPDGRHIVFRSNRPDGAATMRLWRIDIDGGNPVQLAARADFAPHISPDGRWVLYAVWSVSEKITSLWKVSVEGGEPVRVTDYPSGWDDSSYSPDGKWIGCYFRDEQLGGYGIIPASGGRPVRHFQFPGFQYQSVRWTADSRYLSFIGRPPDPSNIWLQPAEGGEPHKLTDFKTDYIYKHAWSRDGKTLTLARGRPAFDVVLLKDNK